MLPWQARSPDLSPIEHVWEILGRRVKARNPQSVHDLETFLREEWNILPQDRLRHFIHSTRRRVISVIDANGGHTRY